MEYCSVISAFILIVIYLRSWRMEDLMSYQWQGLHLDKVVRTEQVHKFNNQNREQQLHTCMASVNYTGMCKYCQRYKCWYKCYRNSCTQHGTMQRVEHVQILSTSLFHICMRALIENEMLLQIHYRFSSRNSAPLIIRHTSLDEAI